ncbi:hypothetical protein C4D60_Mb02t18790 [Musa balbisiana]|uniref:Uncharacterized protein n=1 Tax=Musa balbisiana TaxID=52838 RepID=A0A4S8IBV4_MUSBA|nr:hypothetical protein C4D60_Mb02t18790 [Musa balbisiana]
MEKLDANTTAATSLNTPCPCGRSCLLTQRQERKRKDRSKVKPRKNNTRKQMKGKAVSSNTNGIKFFDFVFCQPYNCR